MLSSDAMHVIHVLTAMNGNGILLSKAKPKYAWIAMHNTNARYVTQRKTRMLSHLLMRQNAQRDGYLRCESCHTCKVCKEWKWNTSFDQTNSVCISCVETLHTCDVCHKKKNKDAFPTLKHNFISPPFGNRLGF